MTNEGVTVLIWLFVEILVCLTFCLYEIKLSRGETQKVQPTHELFGPEKTNYRSENILKLFSQKIFDDVTNTIYIFAQRENYSVDMLHGNTVIKR